VTGTSVLGIKYKDGVMLAADTLCSYGSMAKYKDARRLISINKTLIGGGGEYSDFQSVTELLKRNALEELCTSDSLYEEDNVLGNGEDDARQTWNYLRAVMYNRRNKMNPLWNDLVVAGFDAENECFLGLVDKIGTTYEDTYIATGFGSYLALPILREKWNDNLSEGEARALLEDCMKVLFYRDCRALNRIQIAKVTQEGGVLISDPYELETEWSSASFVEPKGQLDGDGGW
jgi:20S proteasome subunit beta 7